MRDGRHGTSCVFDRLEAQEERLVHERGQAVLGLRMTPRQSSAAGPHRSRSQDAPAPAADPSRGRSTPLGSRIRGQAAAAGSRIRVREDGRRRVAVPSALTGSGWRGAKPSAAALHGPPYLPEPSSLPARGAAFVSAAREAKTKQHDSVPLDRAPPPGARLRGLRAPCGPC
jgi:hypothetical protein